MEDNQTANMAEIINDIPKQHKAAVYDKPGTCSIEIRQVDTPIPGPGEVLVKLTHSGVCHSDWSVMVNGWVGPLFPHPIQPGQVGGHEGVGSIVAFGPGGELFGHKIGSRVGVKWLAGTCMTCEYCLQGFEAACASQRISGYYWPGTFQEYVIAPANYVTRIPDGLDSAAAAPYLCAGVTVYGALKRANVRPGQFVVISGAGGGLGHLAVQIAARGMGLRVIGIDIAAKNEFVLSLGAEKFFAVNGLNPEELVKNVVEATASASYPAEGAHAAIVVSNRLEAYESATQMLRKGGTIVAVGIPEGEAIGVKGLAPSLMIKNSLKFVGSAVGNRAEAIEVLDMAARGIVKTQYKVEPLDKLPEIFEKMDRGELLGRIVVDI